MSGLLLAASERGHGQTLLSATAGTGDFVEGTSHCRPLFHGDSRRAEGSAGRDLREPGTCPSSPRRPLNDAEKRRPLSSWPGRWGVPRTHPAVPARAQVPPKSVFVPVPEQWFVGARFCELKFHTACVRPVKFCRRNTVCAAGAGKGASVGTRTRDTGSRLLPPAEGRGSCSGAAEGVAFGVSLPVLGGTSSCHLPPEPP